MRTNANRKRTAALSLLVLLASLGGCRTRPTQTPSLATASPAEDTAEPTAEPTLTPTFTQIPATPTPAPSPTPISGFGEGALSPTDLNQIAFFGGGGGGFGCEDISEFYTPLVPSVRVLEGFFETSIVCAYGAPIAAGTVLTAELTGPDGDTYRETFDVGGETGSEGFGLGKIVGRRVGETWPSGNGYVTDYFNIPTVVIYLSYPVGLPSGEWQIRISDSGSLFDEHSTFVVPERTFPRFSVLRITEIDPFYGPTSKEFSDGEVVTIRGENYLPADNVIVGIYPAPDVTDEILYGDATAGASFAASIPTDRAGSFEAPFFVGPSVEAGYYYVLVEEDAASFTGGFLGGDGFTVSR